MNTCENELENYKNGRFCEAHRNLQNVCGIVPCGRPVSNAGSVTCNDPAHEEWHSRYLQRFGRLNYPGVRRVIRRQQNAAQQDQNPPIQPGLQVNQQLPNLGNIAGAEVVHTFRAQAVYCIETVQWACGIPIGWGKCYRSESSPQVLAIIDRIWEENDELRPAFIAYDDACDLLRHIITQDPESLWIKSTKFIVDAFHYIGHRATDILCRRWCNPAPTNGSQPDLVSVQVDDDGRVHLVREFNTETAEHLNAWLDGFESQLRQMSATNYDIFVHVLMMLYTEDIEDRIRKKERDLDEDFFD